MRCPGEIPKLIMKLLPIYRVLRPVYKPVPSCSAHPMSYTISLEMRLVVSHCRLQYFPRLTVFTDTAGYIRGKPERDDRQFWLEKKMAQSFVLVHTSTKDCNYVHTTSCSKVSCLYGRVLQDTQCASTPVQDMEIPEARGLIRTIQLSLDCVKPVEALTFLSALQCLCVIHDDCSNVYLYTSEGLVIGCFDTHLHHLTGVAELKTETNVVVCSGLLHKASCVTLLASSSDHIHVAVQNLWTLHFKPCDVWSFKMDLLLVLNGDSAAEFIFTETGHQVTPIRMLQDPGCDAKVPSICTGTRRGSWVWPTAMKEERDQLS